jgi:ABC-type transport system involved in multi-copper enzyme maturation permease subunit
MPDISNDHLQTYPAKGLDSKLNLTFIWLVAGKEIITNFRNFRIPFALVALTSLLLGLAHLMSLDYRYRLSNWEVNQTASRDPIVGGVVDYNLIDGKFSYSAGVGYSPPIQRPRPFSVFIKGIDGEMNRSGIINQRINFMARQDELVISLLFDTPDTSFVMKLFVSLIALLFSLDAITREKEAGTLRLTLAEPIRRREFLPGKWLGISASLLLTLGPAYLGEIFYLQFKHNLFNDQASFARALFIFFLCILYGLVFVNVGFFISILVTRTHKAIIAGLLAWATIVLVLPNVAVLATQVLFPTLTYDQFNAGSYKIRQGLREAEPATTSAVKPSIGLPGAKTTLVRLLEAEQQITDEYLMGKINQLRRARLFASVSPAGALVFGISDLANTGVNDFEEYLELFRSGQLSMTDALKRRLDLSPQAGRKLVQEVIKDVNNRQRADKTPITSYLSASLPMASLAVWAAFFGLAAAWRFKQYDAR